MVRFTSQAIVEKFMSIVTKLRQYWTSFGKIFGNI